MHASQLHDKNIGSIKMIVKIQLMIQGVLYLSNVYGDMEIHRIVNVDLSTTQRNYEMEEQYIHYILHLFMEI